MTDLDDDASFGVCSVCEGSFHRTVLKASETKYLCPTCLNKLTSIIEPYNKKVAAYKRGLASLGRRIKRLRTEAYTLEVAYAKMFNRKRAIELQLTPVKKLPTYSTTVRVRNAVQPLTPEQLLAVLSPEEKARLLRQLGG